MPETVTGQRPVIGFVFNLGRLPRSNAVREGRHPSEFFYGAMELQARGVDVRLFEADAKRPPHWPAAALNFIGPHGPPRLDGCVFESTSLLLGELNTFDCIVATTGAHAFSLAIWDVLGRLRPPLVGIQCGLLNHPINASRRFTTARLLRRMESVLFGSTELEPMCRAYPGIRERLRSSDFGVDTAFWSPGDEPVQGEYILAVGNDGQRDYDTFVAAARDLPWPVVLLTRRPLPPLPAHVRRIEGSFAQGMSDLDLRDLYRKARCVVVPLKQTYQPSGQSVALQAMACARPLVITETNGLWSRELLRDGETVRLAPVADAPRLAEAIRKACESPRHAVELGRNAREAVLRHGRIEQFADGIWAACLRAMNRASGAAAAR